MNTIHFYDTTLAREMIPILTIEALYKNIHLSYIDIYTAPCIKK